MKKSILYIGCLSLFVTLLSSCEIDEKAVPKPAVKPGVANNQVAMGNNYKYQIFFDLETNKAVAQNAKKVWDLGFECGADGFHIILNSSKSMFAYNTHVTDFASLTDTVGKLGAKLWDASSGNLDSTAVGDWRTAGEVYIIDRGYDEDANQQGHKKVQFIQVDANTYHLKMADINGSNLVEKTITKNDDYNFIFMSLTDGATVAVEPPKDTWDIAFTQYTHVFEEESGPLPYLVTGCLLNRYKTTAIKDTLSSFSDINLQNAESATFSNAINTIGYDWKTYTGSTYVVNKSWNYIIRNRKGLYYKMHFISFFNTSGEKGSPSFEYQQL
ncbi:HmuY family protein [Taibaiella lutea]|nr:HmuY family protein [Taibaiella lutea]